MTIPDREHSEARNRASRVSADFQGDREPAFKSKYPYWLVGKGGYALELEAFKYRVWRTFRQHTGHWPIVSICFHFASVVGIIAGLILWDQTTTGWTGSEAWGTFAIGLVLWIVVSEAGTIAARKLDWKLFDGK